LYTTSTGPAVSPLKLCADTPSALKCRRVHGATARPNRSFHYQGMQLVSDREASLRSKGACSPPFGIIKEACPNFRACATRRPKMARSAPPAGPPPARSPRACRQCPRWAVSATCVRVSPHLCCSPSNRRIAARMGAAGGDAPSRPRHARPRRNSTSRFPARAWMPWASSSLS